MPSVAVYFMQSSGGELAGRAESNSSWICKYFLTRDNPRAADAGIEGCGVSSLDVNEAALGHQWGTS